jgi:intracellular septation protein A
VRIKSSLSSRAVAGVMLSTNWLAPYLPPIVTENIDRKIIVWTSRGWGILQIVLAIANAFVALTFSTNVWAWYASIVPTSALVLAFALQYAIFRVLVGRNIRARMALQSA